MAGRTSSSLGVGIAFTVLGLLTLALFVLTFMFFGKYSDTNSQLLRVQNEANDVVRSDERNRDDVRVLLADAQKQRKSLVGSLIDAQGQVMQRVTGAPKDTLATLSASLEKVPGADSTALLPLIASRDGTISDLRRQLADAEEARKNLQAQLQTESDRTASARKSHEEALAAVSAQLDQYKAEVDGYRSESQTFKAAVTGQLDNARTEAAERQAALEKQIAELSEQKLTLQDQVRRLQGERRSDTLNPDDEASLIDGRIVATAGDREAFIDLGKSQRLTLGMTFAVYSDAKALKPNDKGQLPRPKATAEVISVSDGTATVRLSREIKGNPVVRGDVIVNAVYDPKKIYKFVVFGNFDTNNDGIATNFERQDVESFVKSWGGVIENDLGGAVDFLVLGERPILPPKPSTGAPLEVVQEFIRRQRDVERYDELFKKAAETGIPILNQNRLYTLIGR
jgi:hypothetical protein